MLAIPALLGEHVTGPYEGQPKPPLEVVVVTFSGRIPSWIGSCGLFLTVLVFETLVIFVVSKVRKLLERNAGFNRE